MTALQPILVTLCVRCSKAIRDCKCEPRYQGEPEPATRQARMVEV